MSDRTKSDVEREIRQCREALKELFAVIKKEGMGASQQTRTDLHHRTAEERRLLHELKQFEKAEAGEL